MKEYHFRKKDEREVTAYIWKAIYPSLAQIFAKPSAPVDKELERVLHRLCEVIVGCSLWNMTAKDKGLAYAVYLKRKDANLPHARPTRTLKLDGDLARMLEHVQRDECKIYLQFFNSARMDYPKRLEDVVDPQFYAFLCLVTTRLVMDYGQHFLSDKGFKAFWRARWLEYDDGEVRFM